MNMFTQLVQTPLARALGWTLLHFVWEGAAIALLFAVTLLVFRSASARLRYGLACTALAAMPLAFVVTLAVNWPDTPSFASTATLNVAGVPYATPADSGAVRPQPDSVPLAARLSWLTPVWMFGVLVCYLFNVGSWLAARRMRYAGSCAPAPEWQLRLNELSDRMKLPRPVLMLESCLATVPVVIGFLRPLILMPIGMLTSLTPDQVELLLIHELSHIRRHDYLVNLLQKAIEGLLFYHPATWWVSKAVRAERENCCDDVVVSMQGKAREYAETLATLERLRNLKTAVAANGGDLVQRIRRILTQETSAPTPAWPIALLAVGVLAVFSANSAVTPQRTRMQPPAAQLSEQAKPHPAVAPARTEVAQLKPSPAQTNPPQAQPADGDPQLTQLDQQIANAESQLKELSKTLAPENPNFISERQFLDQLRARRAQLKPAPTQPDLSHLIQLDRQIAQAESQLAELAATLTPANPRYLSVQRSLDQLRAKRAELTGREPGKFVGQFWLRRDVLLTQVTPPATVAQAPGAIMGTVQDPSGARVANCPVIVRDAGGQTVVSGSSDRIGTFRFESLPVGHYILEFQAPGFKALTRPADISSGATVAIVANLALGEIAESVTVGRSQGNVPAAVPGAANQPITMGGNVQPARLVNRVKPVYPDELQQQGLQGTVKIQMIVSKAGLPENLLVVPSNIDPRFVQAALDSVRQWRYQPTLLNGMPVEVLTTVDVNFTLGN